MNGSILDIGKKDWHGCLGYFAGLGRGMKAGGCGFVWREEMGSKMMEVYEYVGFFGV